jgi:hypothetical protein
MSPRGKVLQIDGCECDRTWTDPIDDATSNPTAPKLRGDTVVKLPSCRSWSFGFIDFLTPRLLFDRIEPMTALSLVVTLVSPNKDD